MNSIQIEQLHQKQKVIQLTMIQSDKRLVNYCQLNIKIQVDEQIYKELNFIKHQIENVKNELKSIDFIYFQLCDSVSSGKNRIDNPLIKSSKNLENMYQKLSHLQTNNSVKHTSKIRNASTQAVEKQQNRSPISQKNHKITNSFIKWKKCSIIKKKGNYQKQYIYQGSSNDCPFCLFSRLINSSMSKINWQEQNLSKSGGQTQKQFTSKIYMFKIIS
ncbi:unnamed protein product (macronuclear) [Paramecium tetraurelia]|uniref:Uncharacterized protein n=1 Tax=Paramecium tetraurelia TaxID=5888 RepID=A0BXM0_PARTE|nr:uncharacterized protein GSPATT00033140001 [Paramecium tetraurelia]CAK63287.1 unnamed protein product [Paramecium tetraurelia]|eukprot:XP_001430685.1 hypothetical protein (macronuclear) [Paramecium tetraurelia strain d4-2]